MASTLYPNHISIELHSVAQLSCNRLRQGTHPFCERKHLRPILRLLSPCLPLLPPFDHPFDEAAVLLFKSIELRESRPYAQLFGPARVHSRDKRVDCIIEELPSQPALDELGNALFLLRFANKWLFDQTQLAPQGPQW